MFVVVFQGLASALTASEVMERYQSGLQWENKISACVNTPFPKNAAEKSVLDETQKGNTPKLLIRRASDQWRIENQQFKVGKDGSLSPFHKMALCTPFQEKPALFLDTGAAVSCYRSDTTPTLQKELGYSDASPLFALFAIRECRPLAEAFSSQATTISEENLEGHHCYVLESEDAFGQTKAWFAADSECALLRCEIKQLAGKHKTPYAKPGEEYEPHKSQADGKPTTVKREIYSVQYLLQQMGKQYVPISYEVQWTAELADGRTLFPDKCLHTVTDIELDPNFPADEFSPKYDNGTPIILVENASDVYGFHWQDGKIQPDIREGAIASINETTSAIKQGKNAEETSPTKKDATPPQRQALLKTHVLRRYIYLLISAIGVFCVLAALLFSRRNHTKAAPLNNDSEKY
jgi:hypothetical protein